MLDLWLIHRLLDNISEDRIKLERIKVCSSSVTSRLLQTDLVFQRVTPRCLLCLAASGLSQHTCKIFSQSRGVLLVPTSPNMQATHRSRKSSDTRRIWYIPDHVLVTRADPISSMESKVSLIDMTPSLFNLQLEATTMRNETCGLQCAWLTINTSTRDNLWKHTNNHEADTEKARRKREARTKSLFLPIGKHSQW